MNSLFENFPSVAEIDGKKYKLNTDFKVALKIFTAFEDEELTDFEKQAVMLSLLYKEVPKNTRKATEVAYEFLCCGEKEEQTDSTRLYSFDQDATIIYSAMQKSFGVDLCKPMHWYKFVALFSDISEDTFFARIVHLRDAKARGKLTSEERKLVAQLDKYMHIKNPKISLTSEEENFLCLLNGTGKEKNAGKTRN